MAPEDVDWSLWTLTPNLLLVNFDEEAEQVTKRRRKHTAVVVNRIFVMVLCFMFYVLCFMDLFWGVK
jgi:hypothetical protein